MKSWLQDNYIEIDSTHNEEKSAVAKRFMTTLIIKIYKYIISKNVYNDKLDDIVNKYNNTYHRIIKIKSIDESEAYILTLIK